MQLTMTTDYALRCMLYLAGKEGLSSSTDVGRILRTFKIKKNVEVTDNGKIII